jgi:hypothetical protein
VKSSLCCTACDHVKLVLTSLLFVVVSALSAPAVELFRYRYHAEDGREFECVFETDEQSAPKTVGEEKATEIAMDWMGVRMKPHYLRTDREYPGWNTLLRIANRSRFLHLVALTP